MSRCKVNVCGNKQREKDVILDRSQIEESSPINITAMSATITISVTAPADFHVHLRQGSLSELVTKHVRQGGFSLAYVMVATICHVFYKGFALIR